MKVFVSQTVEGKDLQMLERTSSNLVSWLKELYMEEVSEVPMLDPSQFKGQHPVHYLGMSLLMMCQADLVVFSPGWKESATCRLEHDVCEQYGIEHLDLRWLPTAWKSA